MKICIAQIEPEKGNIKKNIQIHKNWIEKAILENIDLIVFSELSLTGYEPLLAEKTAVSKLDKLSNEFQETCNINDLTIGVGIPTKTEKGIYISIIFFRPYNSPIIYSKQKLHSDEKPYFIEGNEQVILKIKNIKIAPAICYESLNPEHLEKAKDLGADVYLASVAKSENGIKKAKQYFSEKAKKYSIPILMSNSIGFCDNFESIGCSSIWNKKGLLIEQIENQKEGILILDIKTKKVTKIENTTANTG